MPRRPARPSRRELDARRIAGEEAAIEARNAALLDEADRDIVKRQEVLTRLRDVARVSLKDVLMADPKNPGRYVLKPLETVPDAVAWAIQSITLRDTEEGQTIDIRLVDRVRIVEDLGKYLGLFIIGDTHNHNHLHLHGGPNLQGVPDDQLVARLHKLEAPEKKR